MRLIDGKRVRDRENGSSITHQVVMECNLCKSLFLLHCNCSQQRGKPYIDGGHSFDR